jgi:hypothetical protein
MAAVEIDPIDGLPAWKGRKVTTARRQRLQAKRASRFVMAEWGWLAPALCTLRADRATRLLLVLCLHTKLRRVADRAGWVELAQHDLKAVGLADDNLSRVVARLEALELVEVQRRPGKRPLLRLVKP